MWRDDGEIQELAVVVPSSKEPLRARVSTLENHPPVDGVGACITCYNCVGIHIMRAGPLSWRLAKARQGKGGNYFFSKVPDGCRCQMAASAVARRDDVGSLGPKYFNLVPILSERINQCNRKKVLSFKDLFPFNLHSLWLGLGKAIFQCGWVGAGVQRCASSFKPLIFQGRTNLGVEPISLYHQGGMEVTDSERCCVDLSLYTS